MVFANFTSVVFLQRGMEKMFKMQIQSILLVSLLRSSWYLYFHKLVWSPEDSNPRKGTCLYSLHFLRYLKGQLVLLQLWSWPTYSTASICKIDRALWSFFHWKTDGAFHTVVIHFPLPQLHPGCSAAGQAVLGSCVSSPWKPQEPNEIFSAKNLKKLVITSLHDWKTYLQFQGLMKLIILYEPAVS